MSRRNRASWPSPAIFVAGLALVAAVAGTAVAGPDATTSAINKKKVKKIATKQIKKLAPGLSVDHADSADTATNAEKAATADRASQAQNASTANNAVNAASAQPAAFARVSASGVLDTANSKNVGSVTRVGMGLYCFSGVSFTPRGGQATVNPLNSGDFYAQFSPGSGGCSGVSGAQALVRVIESSTSLVHDAPFFAVFYR